MTSGDNIAITCLMAVCLLAFLVFLWHAEVKR